MGKHIVIYCPLWQGGAGEYISSQSFYKYNILIPSSYDESATVNNTKNKDVVLQYNKKIYSHINHVSSINNFPLLVGGDHSVSLGSISALSKHYENLGVIYIDAHADVNTPETSPSGNAHGMTLAALLGDGDIDFVNLGFEGPKVKYENLVLFGIRDLDPGEVAYIKRYNIFMLTYEEVMRVGIEEALKQVHAYLNKKVKHVHISFDLDVLDPKLFPGVSVPVAKGFNDEEALHIVNELFLNHNIVSMDIVEYNPVKDYKEVTLNFMHTLIGVVEEHIK